MTGHETAHSGVTLIPISADHELPLIEHGDQPHVLLGQAIDAIGLDVETQMRALRRQPWADLDYARAPAADGRVRRAVVCTVPVFLMWLATLESARVPARLRDIVIAYQRETRDAVGAYWTKGLAVNRRGRTDAEVELIEHAAAGVAGDVLTATHAAHTCVQYLDGRRDMPVGETAASITRKLHGHVKRAHKAAVAAGLDLRHAIPPVD